MGGSHPERSYLSENGIAIGPILFVVALLAVLVSAIAAGSGAFNSDTSAVNAKAQATAILEYANVVQMAVDRVLAKGCADTEVSFENPIVSGYTNLNAPSDKSCHVFNVNGGGIIWTKPPTNTSGYDEGYYYSGQHGLTGTKSLIGGVNPTQDLAMFLPNISKNICEEINQIIFSNRSIPNVVSFGFNTNAKFVGIYWYGFSTYNDKPFSICAKATITYYGPWASFTTEPDQYSFYKVLISH